MTKFKIYAGLKRPYAPLHLIDEKEFLAKVDVLADRAFEDQCTTANPRVPLVTEIKQILLDSYYGK